MIIIGVDPGTWQPVALRAYLAGLLDGEGYIGAKRRLPTPANRQRSPKYSPAVSVAMTDLEPVLLLAKFCGADDPQVARRQRRDNYKPLFQFDLENERAAHLLREVQPFLVAKRARAELVLQLADLRATSAQHRTKSVGHRSFNGGTHDVLALSEDFLARCDSIYTRLLVGAPRSGQAGAWRSGS